MEIDDFAGLAGTPWAALWPVESQSLIKASIQEAAEGKVVRFSADCPTAKGNMKSWEVAVMPVRNAHGDIIALQSLSQDVTRREYDRRETVIVSRELSHRIQNLFAVVDSLIHLSGRITPATRPFVSELRERLRGLGRAIAYIHPLCGDDLATAPRTLKGLIAVLVAPYEFAGANISVVGDDADIGQHAVTSVAMVLNELATNAVKYGAMRDSTGKLSIHLARAVPKMVMRWEEQGSPIRADEVTPGFGTTLLDRTVKDQLGGTIERRWASDGLTVQIEIPLARLVEG